MIARNIIEFAVGNPLPVTAVKSDALVIVEPQQVENAGYSLPHNYEAEQALLGSLLHNNSVFERISELLLAEHFADSVHGRIYSAIARLIGRGQVADPITLKGFFNQDEALNEIGGAEYLIQLVDSVVSIINAEDYARTIRDLAIRRQLIDVGEEVVNSANKFDLENDAIKQIEAAEQKLFDLASKGQTDRGFVNFGSALTESVKTAEIAFRSDSHIVGITTGLIDIDKYLGGLHRSDLLILAGRPSMGKTALATNIAFNAAKDKKYGGPTAFFSLEMSAEQLATRLLSKESKVTSDKIRRGELTNNDFTKFTEVCREINSIPLYIDDTPALTVTALRTRARRLKRQKGLSLIVIDYLQLLQGPSNGNRNDGRVNEVSEITRNLKALAKELDVPIIALSQLSRAVEQREDHRPQLSDLRESGSIEQDSDVVMFIYREEYYLSRKMPSEGSDKYREWQEKMDRVHNLAEVIIAKQRHGPIGNVKLFFNSSLVDFSDYQSNERIPYVTK